MCTNAGNSKIKMCNTKLTSYFLVYLFLVLPEEHISLVEPSNIDLDKGGLGVLENVESNK